MVGLIDSDKTPASGKSPTPIRQWRRANVIRQQPHKAGNAQMIQNKWRRTRQNNDPTVPARRRDEWNGQKYKSLSAVDQCYHRTNGTGFGFFGIKQGASGKQECGRGRGEAIACMPNPTSAYPPVQK